MIKNLIQFHWRVWQNYKYFKNNNCKRVFLLESKKAEFSKLRLDMKGFYYMPRILKVQN